MGFMKITSTWFDGPLKIAENLFKLEFLKKFIAVLHWLPLPWHTTYFLNHIVISSVSRWMLTVMGPAHRSPRKMLFFHQKTHSERKTQTFIDQWSLLYYQPKQWTMNGKSLELPYFCIFLSSPNKYNFMIPVDNLRCLFSGVLWRCWHPNNFWRNVLLECVCVFLISPPKKSKHFSWKTFSEDFLET